MNEKAIDPNEFTLESLFTMEVTTASKFPEKLSEAPGVMSVVTQDELRRYGATTVREALERVPGLMVTTSYFADRSMVAVRGAQAKTNGAHVLILINGRPAREILDGGIVSDLLQSFPVNVIERIEVIRGPGSVMYGTNAFSGVINLITKKAIGHSATFRTYAVEPGAGGASGELMLERGKLNVVAAGQARYDPTWRPRYGYSADPLLGTASSFQNPTLGDRGPGAYLGVNYKGLRFMGAYSEWQAGYIVAGTAGENRWRRGFTNLGYSLAPFSKWDMSFDLTHTLTKFSSSAAPDVRRGSSDTVLEWTNVLKPTRRDQITFGALYNYIEGSEYYYGVSPALTISQGSRNGAGFYAQLEHRLSDEVKLIGGFQSNKIGRLGLDTVPRAGVIWSPTTHVHVKALYGQAFRAPSLNETGLNHPLLHGNPALVPEKVGTLDLGVSYQATRSLFAVNFFDSRQTGIIRADFTTSSFQFYNSGKIRIPGIEFEAKRYVGEHLAVFGSLLKTFDRADLTSADPLRQLPTPRWTVSGGVSYEAKRAFTLSMFDVYHDAVPDYPASPTLQAINPAGPPRLNPDPSAYHMVNAHSRLELSRVFGEWAKGLALFAHGINLANRQIWLPDWGGEIGETTPFSRGRTLYYGLEVRLFRE